MSEQEQNEIIILWIILTPPVLTVIALGLLAAL
jgi:hypothetical protein